MLSVVPLTVTVTGVGALNNNNHNFHAAVTINGVTQNTPSESGSSLFVNWPITEQVENTAGPVAVSIALFDGGTQMDLNPQTGDAVIKLSVDPQTGDYSGDLQYPNDLLQGDGSDGPAGNLSFTVSVPANTSSSGDGIPDAWKTGGIPVGPSLPNYQLPGAVVGHHDLYVEVDAMTGFAPISLPAITSITDLSTGPIVVTTSQPDGLSTGNHVSIAGVGADPAVDGNFTVTRLNATQFSLNNTTGLGNGAAGGGLNLPYSTTSAASGWWLTDIVNADNTTPNLNLATGSDLDLVVNSFLNAPVTNSVGPNGIYLHIETDWTGLDGKIPAATWSSLDSSSWPIGYTTIQTNTSSTVAGGFGSPAERASANATAILTAKAFVYRYCIFGQNFGTTGSSGLSDLPGPDFMVTLGGFTLSAETQAGTFMHEFGHSLGLGHGGEVAPMVGSLTKGSAKVTLPNTSLLYAGMTVSGTNLPGGTVGISSVDSATQITLGAAATGSGQSALYFQDNTNFKPNYQSVMNYEWQIPNPNNAAFDASWLLNYSTQAFPTLNEASLNEPAGIAGFAGLTEGILPTTTGYPAKFSQYVLETGPVDWNGDGNTTETSDSVDTNADKTVGTLVGYNNWPDLVYSFRDGYVYLNGNGEHATSSEEEPNQLSSVLGYVIPAGQGPTDLDLRLNGASLELFNQETHAVVASNPLADTTMVQVYGADNEHNSLTVDFSFGGYFSVSGGISFSGGAGGNNSVRVIGTGQTTGTYTPDAVTPGSGNAQVAFGSQSVDISFAGLRPLEVSGMASFKLVTPLNHNVVVVAAGIGTGGQAAEVISGSSGGVDFESLTFFAIPAFTLDTATNDGPNPNDVINVNATLAGTTTTISTGGGTNLVNVGSLAPAAGGTADQIGGPLVLSNSPAGTTLNLDDTGSTAAKTGFLTSSTITGLGMAGGISYTGVASVNVNLGSGNDIFNIQSTSAATTVNGGAAYDVFNVGTLAPASGGYLSQLSGTLDLTGAPGGTATMVIDDQLDPVSQTYTLTSTTFASPFSALITYSGMQGIVVNGGTANDTLVVDSSGGLVSVANGITDNGGTGFNTLQLVQTGGPTRASDTYSVGPNTGSGTSTISDLSSTQTVFFQSKVPVTDLVPALSQTVMGAASDNTFSYTPGSLASRGLVSIDQFAALEFSNKTALAIQGQNGDDTFNINNLETPTDLDAINIDGGLGDNTLVVNANGQNVLSSMISSTRVNIAGATPVPVDYANISGLRVTNALDALTSAGAVITHAGNANPLVNVLVGSFAFTDIPVPAFFGSAGDFTATVNWGDGSTPTAGTIVQTSPSALGQVVFQVFGTHTYPATAPAVPYQISVAIFDTGSTRGFTPTGGVPTQIVDIPGAMTTATETVDTTGPVIDGVFFNRLNGQVDYIIKDPAPGALVPAGVAVNTLLDSSNYLFTKVNAGKAYPGKWIVTNVTETPDPTIPFAYDVAVTFNGGASIRGGFYLFTIRDSSNGNSSVQDLAGNHLDGVFYGTFPSGNGIAGSDFTAELQAYHNKVFAPQTIIGTSTAANDGNGGLPVAPVHSGIWVRAIPRGGKPIFSTRTSLVAGALPAAKKARGQFVVKTEGGGSMIAPTHAKPKLIVASTSRPKRSRNK
jgi:hypothetical protein